MQKLPDDLNQKFTQILIDKNLPKPEQYFCTKWLRYYWDFCHKYHHNPFILASLPLFLGKLKEKKQSIQQQNQAKFAIGLLYDLKTSTSSQQKLAQLKPIFIKSRILLKETIMIQSLRPILKSVKRPLPIFQHSQSQ